MKFHPLLIAALLIAGIPTLPALHGRLKPRGLAGLASSASVLLVDQIEPESDGQKLIRLQRQRDQLDQNSTLIVKQLEQLHEDLGPRWETIRDVLIQQHAAVELLIHDAEARLKTFREEIKKCNEAPPTIDELARTDGSMRENQMTLQRSELALQFFERYFGENSPFTVVARSGRNRREKAIAAYRDQLRSKYFISRWPDGSDILISKDLTLQENALRAKKVLYNEQKQRLANFSSGILRDKKLRDNFALTKAEMANVEEEIEAIKKSQR